MIVNKSLVSVAKVAILWQGENSCATSHNHYTVTIVAMVAMVAEQIIFICSPP
ncbi:hypothetical protein [Chamaesiphon sp.]|uniref:hypothetical protein n=1 Tax=Chamaesiphon sp. TaxID=2814140 RepID=UPI0035937E23